MEYKYLIVLVTRQVNNYYTKKKHHSRYVWVTKLNKVVCHIREAQYLNNTYGPLDQHCVRHLGYNIG